MPTGVYQRTEKHRLKISKRMKDPEICKKISDSVKRKFEEDTTYRKRLSESIKESYKNGRVPWNKNLHGEEYLKHFVDRKVWNKGIKCPKISKSQLGNKRTLGIRWHHSEESKRKISEIQKGTTHSEESKRKVSESIKKKWQDKKHRKKQIDARKKMWTKPEVQKSMQRGRHAHPNNFESTFAKSFPELTYVGDFSFFVGRKNPDFIIKNTNKCVDLFGNYWHDVDEVKTRMEYFESHGMKLIVIWESEWNSDPYDIFKRMNDFIGPYDLECL